MDIFNNRFGMQRAIQKIAPNKLLMMGDAQFTRTRTTKSGNVVSIDYEGGPAFSVGGVIYFKNLKWLITAITPIPTQYDNFFETVFEVIMQFPDMTTKNNKN